MNKITILFFLFVQFSFGQIIELSEEDLKQEESTIISSKKGKVPVHRDCDENQDNDALRNCLNTAISKHVKDNFNISIADTLNLKSKKVRFYVNFKINTKGYATEIKTNAPHVLLDKEAIRIVKLLPRFKPGISDGKPVEVPYSIPITFKISESQSKNIKFPTYKSCDKILDNKTLKKCSNKKIKDFIKLSFDYDIANVALPLEKSTKFLLEFDINTKGKVENINAKANHKAIAIEAIRVAKRLPKFKKPAYKDGKPIPYKYRLEMTIYF